MDRKTNPNIRTLALLGTALMALTTTDIALAQTLGTTAETPRRYDIAAGEDLGTALNLYAAQSGVEILFTPDLVRGKRTRGLHGEHRQQEALRALLVDTGLSYRLGRDGAYLIEPSAEGNDVESAAADNGDAVSDDQVDQEIVVTGTHIRGISTTVGGQLITVSRDEIDRRNYATVREVLEDLPQNFGGGATGERQLNPAQGSNIGFGNSVNLRGLGPTATLSLVNGRRIPTTGFYADVPDISSIPIAAIERIEILPDGASAVYGSDAVAGVVNLLLRRDYEGIETTARYGNATGTSYDEYRLSQSAGFAWSGGNIFVSYEYNHSDRFGRLDSAATATMDFRPYGGADRRLPYGNPANLFAPGASQIAYVIPRNQDGRNLTPDDLLGPEQADYVDVPAYQDTFPRQNRHSFFGFINQDLTGNLQLFAEGRYSRRKFESTRSPISLLLTVPSSNPFYIDVFGDGKPISVGYSFENEIAPRTEAGISEDLSTTVGAEWDYSTDWIASAYFSYAQNNLNQTSGPFISRDRLSQALANPNPDEAFNPFGDGRVNSESLIRSLIASRDAEVAARIYQANVTTSGTLLSLFGNDVKLAVGGEYRSESFDRSEDSEKAFARRQVSAIFGELFAPFVGAANAKPWARRLQLSLSARYERTQDSGGLGEEMKRSPRSTVNPRIGILYEPASGLIVRGNYGTSFRAPGLSALTQYPAASATRTLDPRDPNRQLYGLIISGAQRDLENETAETWGAGVELTSALTQGPRIRLNYFSVVFRNQVGSPAANIGEALLDPAYARFVNLRPSLADVTAACGTVPPLLLDVAPGDCDTPGTLQFIYDSRSTNIARTKVRGVDFDLAFPFDVGRAGDLALHANGTYLIDYKVAASEGTPYIERVNTAARPLRFRAQTGIVWQTPLKIAISGNVNYANRYRDAVQGRRIGAWTTVNFGVSYTSGEDAGIFGDVTARLTVSNLFDGTPPFYEDPSMMVGYDASNAEPFGRRIAISVSKKW